jgi:hypothetical protein
MTGGSLTPNDESSESSGRAVGPALTESLSRHASGRFEGNVAHGFYVVCGYKTA